MPNTPRAARRLAHRLTRRLAAAALAAGAAGACRDFLTGGDLSTDPNRPTNVTPAQLFVGVQSGIWALLGSDMARVAGLWTQQFEGTNIQYTAIYNYARDETTTNGFYLAVYGGGGLADVRDLEARVRASGDRRFLGVAQVQEAILVGTAADLFGDVPYSEAFQGTAPPKLDDQLAVYDAVQRLLDDALGNLAANGAKDVGPGGADLAYGGDPEKWTALAHTLKARFYLHTAEARPGAYAQALAEARLGISDPADNFTATFSGIPLQQNFWYQFGVVQRPGYLGAGPALVSLLQARNDPRLTRYFNADLTDLAAPLLLPNAPQPLVTAQETRLIWAEAAQRAGNDTDARAQLNAERGWAGLAPVGASVAGAALLREVLTEKYIALYQQIEPWNDYKRTCFPNITPVAEGEKVPVRFFYDAAERQTNPNVPPPERQPFRNRNDPPNATDPFGSACLGQ